MRPNKFNSKGAAIPDPFYAVKIEDVVAADQWNPHLQRLCGQQAVERILMVKWEPSASNYLTDRCFQDGYTCQGRDPLKVIENLGGSQLPGGLLDRHLPWGDS